MYCKHCGAKLPEDVAFCSSCGETTGIVENGGRLKKMKPSGNTKKLSVKGLLFWLAAVIVVVGGIVLVSGNAKQDSKDVLYATTGQDGSAFLVLDNGKSIHIKGNIGSAVCTSDRKHLIVRERGGDCYITDLKQNNREFIGAGVISVEVTRNDGVIYCKKTDFSDRQYFRYSFASEESVPINADYTVAEDTITVYYYDDTNSVYCLEPGASTGVSLGWGQENAHYVEAVSADGKEAVWINTPENVICWYHNGKVDKINNIPNADIRETNVYAAPDMKAIVITNREAYGLAVKWDRGGFKNYSTNFCGEYAGFAVEPSKENKIKGVYVSEYCSENGTYNLYFVNRNDSEIVVSGVSDYEICGEDLCYIDSNNVLFYMQKTKSGQYETKKIDTQVCSIRRTGKDGSLFYDKNYGSEMEECMDLYVYKKNMGEPVLVDNTIYEYFLLSKDYSTIYYYKDVFSTDNYSYSVGNLCKKAIWNQSPSQIIDTNVCIWTVEDNMKEYFNEEAFRYVKYKDVGYYFDAERLMGDLYYSNGKTSEIKMYGAFY